MLDYVFKTYVEYTYVLKTHEKYISIMQTMSDRALLLLKMAKLQDLATPNTSEYIRWQNVKRGGAKVRTEEIEALAELFPAYRWWLMTGEVMPDKGQTSPDYDEANRNLTSQSAG